MNPLLMAISSPDSVDQWTPGSWDVLLQMARSDRVLGRLGSVLQRAGLAAERFPEGVPDLLLAATQGPGWIAARARWELRQVLAAIGSLGVDVVALKGIAYLEGGMRLSEGRELSDIDLLLPRESIDAVERQLLDYGWEHQQLNPYDQRYYRDWMHELPPLRHPQRPIEVDLHHRILPRTSRLNPSTELLIERSVVVRPGLRVLAPEDMLLHAATHLFYDGDVAGRFRELLDVHQLFESLPQSTDAASGLLERAGELQLERPLYYAVFCCDTLLGTPLATEMRERARGLVPLPWVAASTRSVMCRALTPRLPGEPRPRLSAWLLYVRSHWLRMRPSLLAAHLARKALRRLPMLRSEQRRGGGCGPAGPMT